MKTTRGKYTVITLSKTETELYDSGDPREWSAFYRTKIAPSIKDADDVTLETADGIVISHSVKSDRD